MGKGDKKSRRGKIILGSNGVRRPKSTKRKILVKVDAIPVVAVEKNKKATETPKAEPKLRVKAAEPIVITKPENIVTPEKTVKKAIKKAKAEDTPA